MALCAIEYHEMLNAARKGCILDFYVTAKGRMESTIFSEALRLLSRTCREPMTPISQAVLMCHSWSLGTGSTATALLHWLGSRIALCSCSGGTTLRETYAGVYALPLSAPSMGVHHGQL